MLLDEANGRNQVVGEVVVVTMDRSTLAAAGFLGNNVGDRRGIELRNDRGDIYLSSKQGDVRRLVTQNVVE